MKLIGTHSELNKSGIYCIKNLTNEKCYIGSSTAIYYRLKRHYSELEHNRHPNQHLQSSYNKYGKENFIGFVLEFCEAGSLEERETYNIEKLKPVYNKRTAKRDSPILEETRLKISKTLKRKYESGEITTYKQNHAWRKVEQYDLKGRYIQTFPCIAEAGRQLNIEENCIRACLDKRHVSKSSSGFQFKEAGNSIKIGIYNANKNKKTVIIKNIETLQIVKFSSIEEMKKFFKTTEKTIYRYFNKNLVFRDKYKIEDVRRGDKT